MRIRHLVIVALIACSIKAQAVTLREFLSGHGIPTTSLTGSELMQVIVPGAFVESPRWDVASWSLPGGTAGEWPLHLIRMDRQNGATTTGQIQMSSDDECVGALSGISLMGEFALIETHINPSAECLLVVDASLRLRHTLYGFDPHEVEAGQIVLIEDMMHFAPVHPERLQFADLATGRTSELYPAKDDPLRAQLARRNAARMPPPEVCARMDDPYKADLFDETITALGTDHRGHFAMVVSQEAAHRIVEGEPAKTTAAQSVLYVYQHRGQSWAWCESLLSDAEASRLSGSGPDFSFEDVAERCKPTRPVVPNLTNAQMNPFLNQP